ncbi:putative flavodoxin [Arthrobacter globiformis NBRC 12137]|uniref:Putative flavodoxin n=1 Tax=Arthrobacter globiformis (strain ATCC 8010 / DSM 20124 / JCM 1332 / NBRC 12137 / NCIMB 8907 / NRRL B-2979 / 168) TaxID=1077972 RepID=H0QK38_ARTG1|nr:flavodoxin domain-containing protein [Arthrobacter globiformis]GAB13278.1 putative flavodoxin [Arthrobacter globiformis NBRC 12137]
MKISILFGTESGNGELAAEDLALSLADGHDVEVRDLAEVTVEKISDEALFVFICSTYGEGELPNTALPFYTALSETRPDLTGVKFAIFGLGDSFYTETFGHGSLKLGAELEELGAHRVGEFGRHDASTWEPVGEAAVTWFAEVLSSMRLASHPG